MEQYWDLANDAAGLAIGFHWLLVLVMHKACSLYFYSTMAQSVRSEALVLAGFSLKFLSLVAYC
jgi:hypothetical protein